MYCKFRISKKLQFCRYIKKSTLDIQQQFYLIQQKRKLLIKPNVAKHIFQVKSKNSVGFN